MDVLNRSMAPFGADIWALIDAEAGAAAKDLMTVRRFLEVGGPHGPGLTAIELSNDDYCRQPEPGEAGAVMGRAVSVPMLRKTFRLSLRRIAAYLDKGQPLDLSPAGDAAEAVARLEEQILYYGRPEFGLSGLLENDGVCRLEGGDWTRPDAALEDVIAATTRLDEAGFPGPHALVVEPRFYNALFRRYPDSEMLLINHLRRLCTQGIFKANIRGAALIDPRVGRLEVGQDLMCGYVGTDGIHCELFAHESLVLHMQDENAVCVISPSE
ncbi:family 1 encapsulin nanocompartment shell protein [Roseospira visakhapatnamensis]|uniref:Putative linocin/CFP29 family protein n=1 Tax=Roseospira visakhapatnamensis TaxID=390880 RepID=A0A7W6REQ1_9PROT|nr:family 1 encapsulin nanocompartment shell protein [Roseospira visakhapatnamensis]MBB4266669.1 putative linocin/CFP29 family protein [Roseospira visakhapatnamensis]